MVQPRGPRVSLSLSVTFADFEKQEITVSLATELVTLPFAPAIVRQLKFLLLNHHPNRTSHCNHRDSATLAYVCKTLVDSFCNEELYGDTFYRLLSVIRSIALRRPHNLLRYCDALQSALSSQSPAVEIGLKPIGCLINESELLQPLCSFVV